MPKGEVMHNKYVVFLDEISKWIMRDHQYLDFQKAFDKMQHQVLLFSLKAHGIDWIENNSQKTACCSRWGGFKLEISLEYGTSRISIMTFIILNIY